MNEANRTFDRVTQSSIAILIKLLSILDKEKRLRYKEEYRNIVKESKFWKLMVSSDSLGVKKEMYCLVGALADLDAGI